MRWTNEECEWLKSHVEGTRYRALADALNAAFGTSRSVNSVQQKCGELGLSNGLLGDKSYLKGQNWNRGRCKTFSEDELRWIQERCKDRSLKSLVPEFNAFFGRSVSVKTMQTVCRRQGIKGGFDGRFKKGCKTWVHKGIQPGWLARNGLLDEIKVKDGYEYVYDTGRKKRVLKGRAEWERQNGRRLADDEIVIFLDGNRTNYSRENLLAVPRKYMAQINTNGLTEDAELNKTIVALTRLSVERNGIVRKRKTEE